MEKNVVVGLPESCFYIPDFLSREEESETLRSVRSLPQTRWTQLRHRRLMSLPSRLAGKNGDTLIAADLPPFLRSTILPRFSQLKIFANSPHGAPNHCLVNQYEPGQGIMPHEDGPAYYPLTATVSLGGHAVLEIYEKDEQGQKKPDPRWRILQEPRSLLITSGNMYSETLHGIAETHRDINLEPDTIANWDLLGDRTIFETGQRDRNTRVSLTYRDVLKVSKGLRLLGKR